MSKHWKEISLGTEYYDNRIVICALLQFLEDEFPTIDAAATLRSSLLMATATSIEEMQELASVEGFPHAAGKRASAHLDEVLEQAYETLLSAMGSRIEDEHDQFKWCDEGNHDVLLDGPEGAGVYFIEFIERDMTCTLKYKFE